MLSPIVPIAKSESSNRVKRCRHITFAIVLAAVALPLGAFASIEALLAPKAELWESWTAQDPASTAEIDHAAWGVLLARYVKADTGGVNRFDYALVSAADREALRGYVSRLSSVAIGRYARPEQLAYWINLYNALTVQVILDHYPVASIRDIDISPGLFADGPWGAKLATVDGQPVALNDIEHRILRPIWRDPRIHYAVNCASVGCPNLAAVPYRRATVERMLEDAARVYVNSHRGVRIEDGRLIVSSIYVWFGDDFGGGDAAVIEHLRRHAEAPLREALRGRTAIDGHAYDWSLNGARGGS
jgi:hypothetical protein